MNIGWVVLFQRSGKSEKLDKKCLIDKTGHSTNPSLFNMNITYYIVLQLLTGVLYIMEVTEVWL